MKSPNRFTESVWAGRFAVAHPLPAYEPLAGYGWVGEHLGEGVAWLLGHFDEARERVRAGQEVVAREFSPEAIGRAWRAVIASA